MAKSTVTDRSDARYRQLERDIDNELQASRSKYALIGFGRSTDKLSQDDLVAREGEKILSSLDGVLRLEALFDSYQKQGDGEGMAATREKIANAKAGLQRVREIQSQRVAKTGAEIIESAGNLTGRIKSTLAKSAQVPKVRTLILSIGGPSIPDLSAPKKYNLGSSKRIKTLLPKKTIKSILP